MLRINLLPAYVAQRRITRTLVGVYAVLIALVVVVLGGWWLALIPQDSSMRQKAAAATSAKAAVDAVNSQATAAQTAVQPLQANLTWVKAVHQYNLAYPKLYRTVANYTSPNVLYNSISVHGSDLTISGYTPSLPDLGRYLLSMYKEPDASAVALTSPIPGYSSPDPDSPQEISLPAGVTGRLPGYPLPVYSYTVYRGKIVAVNGQGKGGVGAAAGGAQFGPTFGGAARFGPSFGGGQFGPPGGMAGAFGGMAGQANAGKKFDPRHDGFPFTVVLTLKSAPTPPAPPVTPTPFPINGGGGAGAGGFGPGGFGGPGFGGPNMGFRGGGPPPGMGGPPPGVGGPPPGVGGPPPGYADR